MFEFLKSKSPQPELTLGDFWNVTSISDKGFLCADKTKGFMFEMQPIDGTFLTAEQLNTLHNQWRSALRFSPKEELQIIFRKRVEFASWIEDQLSHVFLADNPYGRRILLDRLADQVSQMSQNEPKLLSQKIIVCFWTKEFLLNEEQLEEKRSLVQAQIGAFGLVVNHLNKFKIEREINISAQNLVTTEHQVPEWPRIKIEAGDLRINNDRFRALELVRLPESSSELGMIQAISSLPYPMDLSIRLKFRDIRPLISRLEKKRNLLNSQKNSKKTPSPNLEGQIDQIDKVLRNLADTSESIFDLQMTVGLRFPKELESFQRNAMGVILRAGAQMDFCDFEESTLGTFDSLLECIPGFSGKNIRSHTVLGSNAIHFLPFFSSSKGDFKPIISFQTKNHSIYGIDPVDSQLANYNWLVSGTSGAGKSFFVNSLLVQSGPINPNIFIVDIGGSYNKLTQFLGGKVMSLEPGQGFELSPFFLPKCEDPKEERMRRQHIFQIFLEMTRSEGQLPSLEIRHLLSECLNQILDKENLPIRPISFLIELVKQTNTQEALRLAMLLDPWSGDSFFGQFLDNDKVVNGGEHILTFDLKGLTEFQDLSRVVQLIVCSSLWARVRQTGGKTFSWIVLDEVAFSLLKTHSEFVDELVSTLRKYYAGAIIVVQDLEKITSNFAGSSILQNTQTKAILQQRGDPANYLEALSLNQIDRWAIESLQREKGAFSDIFLIRENEKVVIRHRPSELEYWLSTTAPEDTQAFAKSTNKFKGKFQEKIIDFVAARKRSLR